MLHGLINLSGRSRLPIIRQTEATECGLACLAMVASYHGHRMDLGTLRRRYPVSLKGMTAATLKRTADQLHLNCEAHRFELHHLPELRLPAIVTWDNDHFVVLKEVTNKYITIHDPARGERRCTLAEASNHLTGIVLELTPADEFAPKDERARLPLSSFWGRIQGLTPALVQVFILSAVLQVLVLASPFYMQLAVDEVIAKGDVDLLLVLATGFGFLTAISVASTALRSYILLILQSTMNLQMAANLFRHLLRLPLAYFEKRHAGDILGRFRSLEPIRRLLAEGLIAALIDGIMALATLVMILLYSPWLAVVVLVSLALYAVLRIALYRAFRQRSEAAIEAQARENSTFIETLRAVLTIKLLNRETERQGQWLNRYGEVLNASIRLGRINITFATINQAIFGLENIVTVYLGTRLALDGSLTVGMLFAFMSYKRQFTDKTILLVEKAIEFRMLDLHLERIADIAFTRPEAGHDQFSEYMRPIQGRIELRNVCFRYAETEPFVLENINLTVEPGEFVTIAGPSGSGKTTLLKVMLGLLEPTAGEVLVDSLPLSTIGPRAFREQVAAVMQDDQLLSGSIADNICFFDQTCDTDWMIRCAQVAGIHGEVMAMPMAYNSLIGDMGSALSAGQKQRVLLARALYRRPKILFLDEGTAHLDIDLEHHINGSLRQLEITRVSAAHRPETMKAADRVFQMGKARPNCPAPQLARNQ
jgi:ATP-binding cassette subfamily B protein RaxB